jgi:proline iminopeptidase
MRSKLFCLAALLSALLPVRSNCESALALGEHNVVLNGVRLWYEVAGEKRPGDAPLIYLHGGPGYNSYSFKQTIGPRLERHALLIYLDQRGCGQSERPWTKDYAISTLVEDVEALRKNLGLTKISLMGHSFGGTIALEYASCHSDNVQKLIILDGAADVPAAFDLWRTEIEKRYPDAWAGALSGDKGKSYREALKTGDRCAISKAEFAVEIDALAKVDSQTFHNWQQFLDQRYQKEQAALDAVSGLRNTGELSSVCFGPDSQFLCYRFTAYDRLSMPALIIVGKYDGAVGVDQMRNLADHLPRARFDEFDESAHFPYAEEPEKFEHDIADFLSGHTIGNEP